MAKQSGIHQLRGKVGEHSYYRQTGVSSGLVRGINQGLSARVKEGAEYVNTRLNNAEFGQAGAIAAMAAKMIVPKYRPMMLPFSQSKMAKIILAEIKNDVNTPWGKRNLTSDNVEATIKAALESVRKNDPSNYGVSVVFSEDDDTWAIKFDSNLWPAFLSSIGADGAVLNLLACRSAVGKTTNGGRTPYYPCYPNFNLGTTEVEGSSSEETFPQAAAAPAGPFYLSAEMGIAIIMPFRTIDGTNHILQEHCTFAISIATSEQ